MRTGRLKMLAVTAAVACLMAAVMWALPALGSNASGEAASPASGYPSRAFQIQDEPWGSECDPFGCVVESLSGPRLVTSPAIGRVDITLTVTLDLKTTKGDFGAIYATIGSDIHQQRMAPGKYFVMSPSPTVMTTTTLVWAMQRVPARGLTYYFFLTGVARDGDHDKSASIDGVHVTMVAEATEA